MSHHYYCYHTLRIINIVIYSFSSAIVSRLCVLSEQPTITLLDNQINSDDSRFFADNKECVVYGDITIRKKRRRYLQNINRQLLMAAQNRLS